ncbi:MAG: hypothetical protein IPJ77_01875 [Planctomycetes bacterium]|nr:hypothetical protein [Planctomycetota bacterium]
MLATNKSPWNVITSNGSPTGNEPRLAPAGENLTTAGPGAPFAVPEFAT